MNEAISVEMKSAYLLWLIYLMPGYQLPSKTVDYITEHLLMGS